MPETTPISADSTQRFTSRVDNYARYRPGYPPGVLDVLRTRCGMTETSVIADIGSGTGISSGLFLSSGMTVFAVEPNDAMRGAAERSLGHSPMFHSVNGTAEHTTLPDESIDLIFCAQAFHWCEPIKTPREFRRIAKAGAHVALVWNNRPAKATPFIEGYEQLLQKYGIDYANVKHRGIAPSELNQIFSTKFEYVVLSNAQEFDFAGLKGRLLSSSYAPAAGHPNHEPMLKALAELFERNQQDGRVTMLYDTEVYISPL